MIARKDTVIAEAVFLIAAFALALGVVGPSYSGYRVKIENLKSLESLRTKMASRIGGMNSLSRRLANGEKEVKNAKERIRRIRSRFIRKGDTQAILSIIGRSASLAGADIVFVDSPPRPAATASGDLSKNDTPTFDRNTISLRIEAGYYSVSRFISELMDAPYEIGVRKLVVAKKPNTSGELTADMELEVIAL